MRGRKKSKIQNNTIGIQSIPNGVFQYLLSFLCDDDKISMSLLNKEYNQLVIQFEYIPKFRFYFNQDSDVDIVNISWHKKIHNLDTTDFSVSLGDIVNRFTKLRKLNVWNCRVSDVTPLLSLYELIDLNMCKFNGDLKQMSSFNKLQCLYISQFRGNDISPLSSLSLLQRLELRSFNGDDLSPLSSLTRLTYLRLTSLRTNYDISPLSTLTRLQFLDIASFNGDDISPLGSMLNLNDLNLAWFRGTDISPLRPLTRLNRLCLESFVGDSTKNSSLTILDSLTRLKNLNLYSFTGNPLPILSHTQLQYLNLAQHDIDIASFSHFTRLEELWLLNCAMNGEQLREEFHYRLNK